MTNGAGQMLFNSTQIILIFVGFFAIVLFSFLIKKIFYRLKYKKRYFIFPKMSVKGIANVAMVISIAVAIILLLTILTAGLLSVFFRAYPGWRIAIEGVLINVGGLLFGPIIGIFVGASTDLLTVALTAGAFHYGYFIAAMLFGLISGLIRTTWNASKQNQVYFTISAIFIMLLSFMILAIYIGFQPYESFSISLFGLTFKINKEWLILILSFNYIAVMIILITSCLISNRKNLKYYFLSLKYSVYYKIPMNHFKIILKYSNNKQKIIERQLKWYSKHFNELNDVLSFKNNFENNKKGLINIKNWYSYLAPCLVAAFVGESIVDILFLPIFDIDFSGIPFDYWLALRTITLPFIATMNVLIMYPIFRIVSPSMNYKYEDDQSEDINIPLIIE